MRYQNNIVSIIEMIKVNMLSKFEFHYKNRFYKRGPKKEVTTMAGA